MIKSIDDIRKELKENTDNFSIFNILILKKWADSIVEECVSKVELTDFAREFLQEEANNAINIYSILNIKEKIK